jgi:hypothetical protein
VAINEPHSHFMRCITTARVSHLRSSRRHGSELHRWRPAAGRQCLPSASKESSRLTHSEYETPADVLNGSFASGDARRALPSGASPGAW